MEIVSIGGHKGSIYRIKRHVEHVGNLDRVLYTGYVENETDGEISTRTYIRECDAINACKKLIDGRG